MSQTKQNIPDRMKAIAIDRFGGPEELKVQHLGTPHAGPGQIVIRLHTAGVGVWDAMDREGFFAEQYGSDPAFPYVLGGEGAGIVTSVGSRVTSFQEGDRVYAYGADDPQATFYAEYVAVDAQNAALIPENLGLEEAGTMPADAITALCGLAPILDLQASESLLIFGASGGLGHLAVQFAKRMGVRVFAIASGADGVELVQKLGADATINGYKKNIVEEAQSFAPDGFDTALLTAGGEAAEQAISTVRNGGRVAYPNGVQPVPKAPSGVQMQAYNGRATPALFDRLNQLIEHDSFTVNVAQTFPLSEATKAHRTLQEHYLGKLALSI